MTILTAGPQSRRIERGEREKFTALFPIHLDDAVMDALQPWAADIGDFTHWKEHDAYAKALERVLRGLSANPART
jgi:hypothetical protein